MKANAFLRPVVVAAPLVAALVLVGGVAAQAPKAPRTPPSPATSPGLPSEMPAKFEPVTDAFDYVRREVMIPMRDGVKLHTVILVPEGRQGRADPAHPHAVRRRPSSRATPQSAHLGPDPARATTTRPT